MKPEGPEARSQAQWHFREVSRERAKKQGRKKPPPADKLIPITVAPEPPNEIVKRKILVIDIGGTHVKMMISRDKTAQIQIGTENDAARDDHAREGRS